MSACSFSSKCDHHLKGVDVGVGVFLDACSSLSQANTAGDADSAGASSSTSAQSLNRSEGLTTIGFSGGPSYYCPNSLPGVLNGLKSAINDPESRPSDCSLEFYHSNRPNEKLVACGHCVENLTSVVETFCSPLAGSLEKLFAEKVEKGPNEIESGIWFSHHENLVNESPRGPSENRPAAATETQTAESSSWSLKEKLIVALVILGILALLGLFACWIAKSILGSTGTPAPTSNQ